MAYLLLTGATGLVGRYVLRELLDADVAVAVVVRRGKLNTAQERVEGVLSQWERRLGRILPRPVVLEGDLCEQDLGLPSRQRRWIGDNCEAILHCAASMTFRADRQGEPFRTNVEGTRHVLRLCEETAIVKFHHVSTAYICGLREGRILESEVDIGQSLGNVYEQSKLQAEKMIRQAGFLEQRTFYRPASVVGDSQTGYVTSFHGFYLPLQLAFTIASRVPVADMNERFFARLGLAGNEGKNLVPVDWLASAIVYLVTHPQTHGETYHLASPNPVPVREVQRVVQDAIQRHYPGTLAESTSEADLKTFEGLFHDYMLIYRSHWRDDPIFDLTNSNRTLPHLPCPEMTYEMLMRISRYPVENGFSVRRHEEVETDFDVQQHLQHLLPAGQDHRALTAGDDVIGLQVNGRGGGQWQLRLSNRSVTGADPGLPATDTGRFYLSAATFRSLVERQLTVQQSIDAGRLVVEGTGNGLSKMIHVLEQVVADERVRVI